MNLTNEQIQALKAAAESQIGILENIAGYEPSDIDCDDVELRFETEEGFDTGCNVSIVEQCQKSADVIRSLLAEREADKALIAELNRSLDAANERYENRTPTEWAYEQACAAIEKNRARADNAELEARTLTVDLRKHLVNEVMIISQMDRQYSEGWCSANDWAILKIREACAAAGITLVVGGEDADC